MFHIEYLYDNSACLYVLVLLIKPCVTILIKDFSEMFIFQTNQCSIFTSYLT